MSSTSTLTAARPMQSTVDDVHASSASERLLEDSWETRSREATSRGLVAESIAGALFLGVAGIFAAIAGAGHALDVQLAAFLVVLYALVSRIEFPIGAGYFVPSYLVLVPMFVLLPPAEVPLLVAFALVLGAAGQWVVGRASLERLLFSIPDAWHAIGPALVLVTFGQGHSGVELAAVFVAAFLAASLFDLISATVREAAAFGVAPQVQIRVHAQVWLVDACLAPIGLLAAQAASQTPARVLFILPLSALLFVLARDRTARIVQAQHRREQAFTDPLTGLGNRRLLAGDLREQIETASEEEPVALIMLDLNGFKTYNDTFGHGAGDALLARLGAKLAAAVEPHGTAYRLGGDEFCVLVDARWGQAEITSAAASDALTEFGDEFAVTAAYGTVLVPQEVDDPDHALHLADLRMYERKHGRSAAAREDAQQLLMRSMDTQRPMLYEHSVSVAEYSARVGRRMGMDAEEIDVTMRAAELHDLGKVGIPDTILDKPGALDENQWELMRQHTILGERILNAAPAMRPVARIVRATHERWDGRGYPDGTAAEQIPLGARIVAVCDAYSAMIDKRPYASTRTHQDACRELRREAGRQFDAEIVEIFLAEVDSEPGDGDRVSVSEPGESELGDMTAYLRELMHARHGAAAHAPVTTEPSAS